MPIGEKMKEALKYLQYDQTSAANKLGMTQPALSQWFTGKRNPDAKQIENFCQVFNIPPSFLFGENNELSITHPLKSIYKIGYVQAGKFNEACQLPENEWESIPFAANENYKNAKLFALGVRGDSMNLTFPPERTTLICCPLDEWLTINAHAPLEGRYIIAYCRRPDGTCEATVKKYTKIDDTTIILVAESSNPDIKPIILRPDSNQYEIAAVVIGDLRIY